MSDLDNIRNKIQKSMNYPKIQTLEEIQKELEPHVAELEEVRKNFHDLVNEYYTNNPPFEEWQELGDCIPCLNRLIGFAAIAGSYQLIDRWGVKELKQLLKGDVPKLVEIYHNGYKILKPGTWWYSEYLIKGLSY
jgi:hypothetical protein